MDPAQEGRGKKRLLPHSFLEGRDRVLFDHRFDHGQAFVTFGATTARASLVHVQNLGLWPQRGNVCLHGIVVKGVADTDIHGFVASKVIDIENHYHGFVESARKKLGGDKCLNA